MTRTSTGGEGPYYHGVPVGRVILGPHPLRSVPGPSCGWSASGDSCQGVRVDMTLAAPNAADRADNTITPVRIGTAVSAPPKPVTRQNIDGSCFNRRLFTRCATDSSR